VIQGLAAGYQHAFAIAHQPGAAQFTKLKVQSQEAAAAAEVSVAADLEGNNTQLAKETPGVVVVLSEQQLRERVEYIHHHQQQQQQAQPELSEGSSGSPMQENLVPVTSSSGAPQAPVEPSPVEPSYDNATASSHSSSIAIGGSSSITAGSSVAGSTTVFPLGSSPADAASPTAGEAFNPLPAGPSPPPPPPPLALSDDQRLSYLQRPARGLPDPQSVQEVWASWQPRPWHQQLEKLSGTLTCIKPSVCVEPLLVALGQCRHQCAHYSSLHPP
jgi:hypothetical protein